MSTPAPRTGEHEPPEPTSTMLIPSVDGMPARVSPADEFERMSERRSFASTK
jgi:hypothetical protein